jgi:DNA-binding response OmpR family regulator
MNGNAPQKKTILLVEDDTFLVNMYKAKFENNGFNVIVAGDGEQGLNLALTSKIDVIILDLMLPKLSGLDLLTRLRKEEVGKDMPVIVLSNLSEEKEAKSLYDLGVKDFLVKANLTPTQLVEKIQEYFNKD